MEDYLKMIGLKTAVLIACSAKLGAIIAGAEDKDCDLLYRYGYDLGLAFQIADDWLDTYADPKVFGKAIGGDILNNKKNWLMTRAFEKASAEAFTENFNGSVTVNTEIEIIIASVLAIVFLKTLPKDLDFNIYIHSFLCVFYADSPFEIYSHFRKQ